MWEIWKSTTGRQLSVVETAKDKVFVTHKMVCSV